MGAGQGKGGKGSELAHLLCSVSQRYKEALEAPPQGASTWILQVSAFRTES